MTKLLDEKQMRQENKYVFPYHYIPEIENGIFTQTKNLFWGYEYLSYIEFIIEQLGHIKFDSLLDIGCGEGKFLYEAQKAFPNKKFRGIDYSEKPILYARAFNPSIEFKVKDVTKEVDLSLKSSVITLIDVLEHIPTNEVKNFLIGVHLYLDDAGYLIITVPSKNAPTNPKHYQHFSSETISSALESMFTIENIFYLNSLSWQNSLIQKLFSNRFFILNSKNLRNKIYNFYKRKLLLTSNDKNKRLCVIARKK